MSNMTDILRHSRFWFPYIRKYAQRYGGQLRYAVHRRSGYDQFCADMAKLEKYTKSESRLTVQYVIENMRDSFLCQDIDWVLRELRTDERFMLRLKETAEEAKSRHFLILGEMVDRVYDAKAEHYRWQDDIIADYRYVLTHSSQVRIKNQVPGVDIKNPWELSRMQYLFAPALHWRLTGDESSAMFVTEVLDDWIQCNRVEEGPNWNISMEAGIRVSNMLLAFQLISDYRAMEDAFASRIVTSAYQHMTFILRNEEKVADLTTNHYLGGLLGLLSVTTTFPFLPHADSIKGYAHRAFEAEVQKQILEDGGCFEGSVAYQRLIGEMFAVAAVLLNHSQTQVSPAYLSRMRSAAEYAVGITRLDGSFPQIGDNDSGRVFQLFRDMKNSNAFMVALASSVAARKCSILPLETMCFMGRIEQGGQEAHSQIRIFEDSRHAVYRSENTYCILTAGDAHRFGMRAHLHNDKLSVELMYRHRDFIVDPGSGCYTPFPAIHAQLASVRSHSTVQMGDVEQNADYGPFADLSNPTQTKTVTARRLSYGTLLAASMTMKTAKISCRLIREIRIDGDERRILIHDHVCSATPLRLVFRFVLHPDVRVECKANRALLRNGDVCMELKAPGEIHCSEGLYSESYGKWETTKVLSAEEYCSAQNDCRDYRTEIYLR